MKIIKSLQQRKDDNDWSSLPTLLLWMIKDRLDYHNIIRFALVCKNWQHASESYPKIESKFDNSPPWIMSYKEKITDSRRTFISSLTEERFTFDNPEFSASEVLYSKEGWLLLLRLKLNKDGSLSDFVDTKYDSPYLLFNPFKNKKIGLPFLFERFYLGAFSIQDGNPECVVIATSENSWIRYQPTVVVYITYPEYDNIWLRYSCPCRIGEYVTSPLFVSWIFFIRNLVYFVTKEARVFIFNITNMKWKDMRESSVTFQGKQEQHIVERQGELLQLNFPQRVSNMDRDSREATCYKLKIGENVYWEPVDGNIFASTCFGSFSKLSGGSFIFVEAKDEHELVKLMKTFRRTLSFCTSSKSNWVLMG